MNVQVYERVYVLRATISDEITLLLTCYMYALLPFRLILSK